jgi:hypothetical protein
MTLVYHSKHHLILTDVFIETRPDPLGSGNCIGATSPLPGSEPNTIIKVFPVQGGRIVGTSSLPDTTVTET